MFSYFTNLVKSYLYKDTMIVDDFLNQCKIQYPPWHSSKINSQIIIDNLNTIYMMSIKPILLKKVDNNLIYSCNSFKQTMIVDIDIHGDCMARTSDIYSQFQKKTLDKNNNEISLKNEDDSRRRYLIYPEIECNIYSDFAKFCAKKYGVKCKVSDNCLEPETKVISHDEFPYTEHQIIYAGYPIGTKYMTHEIKVDIE